jgi:UDP-N-acetylmuramate dehydrogenase
VTHVVFALSRVPQPRLDYGHLKAAVEAMGPELTSGLIRKVIIKIRKEKLPEPSVKGSAGSFFKNPVISMADFQRIEASAKAELGADYKVPHYDLPDGTVKVPAAWMIEQCGWKGKRSGGAAVWDKQPLVIVNHTGDAYPEEIVGLEKRIIASVRTKFGVELSPEVEHV